MAFSFGTFLHFWLLAALADVADKTFILIALFAMWCPLCGFRNHVETLLHAEYLFLLMGSSFALVLRSILLACGVSPFGWDGFSATVATITVIGLAVKATYQLRLLWSSKQKDCITGPVLDFIEDGEKPSPSVATPEPTKSKKEKGLPQPKIVEETAPLASGEKAESSDKHVGYGAAVLGAFKLSKMPTEKIWSLVATSFFLPCCTIMFAEAMDKSSGTLMSADYHREDLALGASLGFISSASLAILCGFTMMKNISETKLIWGVTFFLWIIGFCCLRDALLRLLLGAMPRESS